MVGETSIERKRKTQINCMQREKDREIDRKIGMISSISIQMISVLGRWHQELI